MKNVSFSSLIVLALLSLLSCGGGGGGDSGGGPKQDITVTVGPKTVSVAGGETQQFTASILNPNNTGVTWTLTGTGCTGDACGTLGNAGGNNNQGWTIVYTAPLTLPSPATVTLKATSKDDGTKSDTATVTITAPVVKVSLTPATPTVIVGASQQFTAGVTGTASTAVTWTTSGPGTISSSGLYTAPAVLHTPATVTVTATSQADNTKSATVTISIPLVTLSLSPEVSEVSLGGTQQFSATVANATNTAVTWTVWGPGSVDSSGLYTAPATLDADTAASVTATSLADPDLHRSISFTVHTTPTITPGSATVPAGATQQFTADVPVTWGVGGVQGTDPATWGTITADGVYTAPLSPPWTGKINIKAVLKTDPRHYGNAVATVVFSNATLQGHYAMRYRGLDAVGALFGVASFEADGKGAISSGSMSFYHSVTAPASVPITGTYAIKPDGRGSATFNFQYGGESVQFPLSMVLTSNSGGRVIGFDDTGTGWGNIDLQTGLTSPADLFGTYVFTADGLENTPASGPVQPIAMAGMFSAGGGTISSAIADINDGGSLSQNVAFTGTYTPLSLYQPFVATLNVSGAEAHFILYQVNPDVLIFISGDSGTGYLGVAVHQDTSAAFSNASLSGNVVFESTGYDPYNHLDNVALGRFTADGQGYLTDGVFDNILSHPAYASSVAAKIPLSGYYSIQPNGRGTMTLSTADTLTVYMIAPNNLVYVCMYPNYVASTGQFLPQSGTFDLSTIRGSWGLNLRETLYYWPGRAEVIAQITSDGAGNLTGTADVNAIIPDSPNRNLVANSPLTGTYTMDSNGRGEAVLNINGGSTHYAIYASSGRTLFMIPIEPSKWAAMGIAARQF